MGENKTSTRKTVSNIFKVASSNFINLLSGVLVAFLLPKAIGVTDYGYYKIFTLYAGYVGLFHFGIIDGILLKYGDKNYDELEKTNFRFYSKFLFWLEFSISFVLAVIGVVCLPGEMKFIFICVAINLLGSNMTAYYQYISQITNRFSELSHRIIVQSSLTCGSVFLLWIIHIVSGDLLSYKIYTIIFCTIKVALCIWYINTYREITFGKTKNHHDGLFDIFEFIKIGIPLMVANLAQSVILNIDRQFVSVLFDTESYAVYAFAYNMLGLITTATSAIATVLYPTMKRTNQEKLGQNYNLMVTVILITVFGAISVFFPLCWFIGWFLPKYSGSLIIFRIILPGLAVSSVITIVMMNYYKVIGNSLLFFGECVIVLLLSSLANYIAYKVFGTTISISIASIIIMVVWYYITEYPLLKKYKIRGLKNVLYLFIMSFLFYVISSIDLWWIGFILYATILLIVTYLFYKKEINIMRLSIR